MRRSTLGRDTTRKGAHELQHKIIAVVDVVDVSVIEKRSIIADVIHVFGIVIKAFGIVRVGVDIERRART